MAYEINSLYIYNSENINFKSRKFRKNKLLIPTNTGMMDSFGPKNVELIRMVGEAAHEKGEEVFLFGGAVRDCLFRKPINDLDFIINGDAIAFAQDLKAKYGNVFKKTFPKPSVKRAVVYTDDMGIDIKPLNEDCSTIKGKESIKKALTENLMGNDFSINSMVIRIDKDKTSGNIKLKFLDYLHGKKDLANSLLKHNKKESFLRDPIKALRGIRFCIEYGLKIQAKTKKLLDESLKKPRAKENLYYYRLIREYLKISKEYFCKTMQNLRDIFQL